MQQIVIVMVPDIAHGLNAKVNQDLKTGELIVDHQITTELNQEDSLDSLLVKVIVTVMEQDFVTSGEDVKVQLDIFLHHVIIHAELVALEIELIDVHHAMKEDI